MFMKLPKLLTDLTLARTYIITLYKLHFVGYIMPNFQISSTDILAKGRIVINK